MSVSNMKKLTAICPLNDGDVLLKKLVRLRCVELRSSQGDEYGYLLENVNFDTRKNEIEKKINVLEKIIPHLNKRTTRKGGLKDNRKRIDREEFISSGGYAIAWEAANKANETLTRMGECTAHIQACNTDIMSLSPWLEYDVAVDYSGTKYTDTTLGVLPANTDMEEVQGALEDYLCWTETVHQSNLGIYLSVTTHKNHTDSVLRELTSFGFLKTVFKGMKGTPIAVSEQLNDEVIKTEKEYDSLEDMLCHCAEFLSDIEILWDIEKTNLVVATGMQKMAKTQKCAVLSGWLPEGASDKVSSALDKICCAYEIYEPLEGEEPPIHLENNRFASCFEWVVGMYSYPKYGSFDPTFIMSIFYFFIFGLMFADVGYGLLVALGGFIVPRIIKLSPSMKRSFYMFGFCGISSMIMGFIFGGWFGDMPYAIMQNFMGIDLATAKEVAPIFNGFWFNPIDDPMKFLIVSLAVGGVHLIAGMLIKFVILCKEGKVLDAIFDIGSWWVIFAGIGVLVLVGTVPGLIVCGVGVLMIVLMKARDQKNFIMRILKGLLGLYDITSYASDLLSYSRILALGLASAVIAQVINLIGTMVGPGIVGFIAFILAFLIGHVLNLAINILGAFVHTSRLQYLEFFGKFYEDGGTEFKALEPSEKYTVD